MRYVSLYDPTIPMIVHTKCVNHKDNHAVVYDKQLRGYCVRCEIFGLLKGALSPDPITVALDCVVRYTADDRPTRILSVHDLTVEGATEDLDASASAALPDDVDARLGELAALQAGWLDGDGSPVSAEAFSAGRPLLAAVNHHLTNPRLYPTSDGGLRIEWTAGPIDLSVEIAVDGSIYAHALIDRHLKEHCICGWLDASK